MGVSCALSAGGTRYAALAADRTRPEPPSHSSACPQEHETALRYFQRALQLDPTLPYAYTLAGALAGWLSFLLCWHPCFNKAVKEHSI